MIAGAEPERAEAGRDPARHRVDLRVGERVRTEHDGEPIGREPRLMLEKRREVEARGRQKVSLSVTYLRVPSQSAIE